MIPNSVTNIGFWAFYQCWRLPSVIIPEGVISIQGLAFEDCWHGLTSVTIPSTVTNIGWCAFAGNSGKLTAFDVSLANPKYASVKGILCSKDGKTVIAGVNGDVKIPEGVTSIGHFAFYGCYNLTSVTIPSSVTSIGSYTFSQCSSLTSVTILSSVTSIKGAAFYDCASLTSVTMKSEAPYYLSGSDHFPVSNSGFRIYVPHGCADAYKSAEGWSDYAEYIVESSDMDDEIISGVDGNIKWELNTASGLLTLSGNGTMNNKYGVTFYDGNMVTTAPWGPYYALIKEIDIKEGVTSIGRWAFDGCNNLMSVTIPSSVTSIEEAAFYDCASLTSVTIPSSVVSIAGSVFSGCSLTSIIVEGGNTVYDSRDNCNAIIETRTNTLIVGCVTTTFPSSVTSIGNSAFYKCLNLSTMTISSSVTSIGSLAFSACSSLTSVRIPSSVTNIEPAAFGNCSNLSSIIVEEGNLVYDSRDNCNAIIETRTNTLILGCPSTTIPSNVTSIGNSAFSNCDNLTSVTIPEGVTSIGEDAFLYCYDLTSVTIPSSVTSIGDWAFYGCYGLTSVTVFWTRPLTISDETFDGCYDATLLVPVTCISRYANATEWQKFHTMSGYNTFDENEWEALVALHAELQAMGATLDWNMQEGVGSLSMYEELEINEDHIIGMDLSAIGIAGLFPATLASFSKLESLDLSENHLSGNLSTVLTELKSQNDEAFQALKTFDISHNRYEGNLGVVSECLPTLTSLQASYNQFSDLTPALPSSVNKIDISHQMMDNVVELNLSHLSYGEVMAMIPAILLYDPTSRSYTNGIDLLCTKANLATYDKNTSTDWAMQLRFADGQWSIPYVSSQNAYYGASGDTLNVLHLTDGSSFKIALSFDSGDANFLDGVDATDLQATILYAFGAYGTHPFNFTAANTYPDDLINVQDVIRTVDILLTTASDESAQNSVKMSHGKSAMDELAEEETEAYVYLYKGKLCLRSSVPVASLSIQAKGNVTWNLTRFGMQQSTAGGNVVGYSLVGATIPANEDVILGEYGEVEIRSVSLSDSDAQPISVSVKGKEATSVSDILDGDLDKTDIYDMSGIKRNTLQEGVNIVKRNGSTIKIYNK